MTRNRFYAFLALATVLLFFVYIQKNRAKESYLSQKEELLLFEKQAGELAKLKSKHKDKKVTERLITSLLKIKTPDKDYKKADSRILEFNDVDKNILNRLIKKIQNSTLEVIKFDILRVDESKAKVRLEIKK
jgi:urate oxidase